MRILDASSGVNVKTASVHEVACGVSRRSSVS